MPALRSYATPDHGNDGLDQARSVAGALQAAQGCGGSAILLRGRTQPLARAVGAQGQAPEDFGCITPSPATDQGQTLPLHAGSPDANRPAAGPGRIPSPAPAGKAIAACIGRH